MDRKSALYLAFLLAAHSYAQADTPPFICSINVNGECKTDYQCLALVKKYLYECAKEAVINKVDSNDEDALNRFIEQCAKQKEPKALDNNNQSYSDSSECSSKSSNLTGAENAPSS